MIIAEISAICTFILGVVVGRKSKRCPKVRVTPSNVNLNTD